MSINKIDNPIISIGLPVYHAEKFIHKRLENILSQSFQDFEELVEEKKEELLDKFEMRDLKDLCKNILGEVPESEWDEEDGEEYEIKPKRKNYLEFIDDAIDNEDLNFEQIKNFSIKRKIISKSFFDFERQESGSISKFEEIIQTIQNEFPAEKIYDEKELQAQLTIFLKTKYPDSEVEREISNSDGGFVDILMDDKYAFELNVNKNWYAEWKKGIMQIKEIADKVEIIEK